MRTLDSIRLKQLLKDQSKTQKELADYLGYFPQRVNNWFTNRSEPSLSDCVKISEFLSISFDDLLGLKVSEHRGLRWSEEFPSYITKESRKEIEIGLSLFRDIVIEGKDLDELHRQKPYKNYDWKTLPTKFMLAVRSGVLRILAVPRVKPYIEAELISEYGLADAIVADLPFESDETNVGAELVAFLAARDALDDTTPHTGNIIGIGPGSTMVRFAEQTIPNDINFQGVTWASLVGWELNNFGPNSANYAVSVLASRYSGSRSLFFPFIDANPSATETKMLENILQAHRNMSSIFASVNGYGRKPASRTKVSDSEQFRASDYGAMGTMNALYSRAVSLKLQDQLAGEFLGIMMTHEGEQIDELRGETRRAYSQIPFWILKDMCEVSKVWIVASGKYKALPTRTLLRNKIANAVVIDSQIAHYLLSSKHEESNAS